MLKYKTYAKLEICEGSIEGKPQHNTKKNNNNTTYKNYSTNIAHRRDVVGENKR